MSDSGFSQLPPGGRVFDPAAIALKREQAVKIDFVRGDLGDAKRATRVQGEIKTLEQDGRATIRTDSGAEIDIKIRGRVSVQEGQRIEIDLPPGAPPRQAVIRPAPDSAPQAQPRTPVAATTSTSTSAPIKSPEATPQQRPPIPPDLRGYLDEVSPPPPAQKRPDALPPLPQNVIPRLAPLPADALLRLTPLSAFPPASSLLQPTPLPPGLVLPAAIALSPLSTSVFSPKEQSAIAKNETLLTTPLPAAPTPLPGPIPFAQHQSPLPQQISPPGAAHLFATTMSLTTSLPAPQIPQALAQPPLAHLTFFSDRPAPLQTLKTMPARLDARLFLPPTHGGVVLLPTDEKQAAHPHLSTHPLATIPASTATTLQAHVIGLTPQHLPVLSVFLPGHTEGTPYLLQIPTGMLPAGTALNLALQPGIPTPAMAHTLPAASARPTPATELFSGWAWPVFDDALDVMNMQAAAQNIAAQSLAKIIPTPANPAQMGPAILFFVAAIRAGDIGGWMGDKTLNALKRDGARGNDILSRLSRDFAGLSKTLSEPLTQDWRGLSIPYVWQNDIQKMHLYFRHQGGDDKDTPDDQKNRSTRFIFDLHLDRMGDVQLDGLMKGPRLDLILRTHTPFVHTMQTAMRQKYLDILEAGNLHGDLAFQTKKDQWVRVDTRLSSLKTTA